MAGYSFMRRILTFGAVLFLLNIPVLLLAQSYEAKDDDKKMQNTTASKKATKSPDTLKEVVVKAEKAEKSLYKEFPGTVNVVTAKQIDTYKPTNVSDVIRHVPSVNYLDEDGRGLRPDIGLRGLNPVRSRNVMLLMDGFPIQPSLYGDPAAYYDPPVETIDHIEVIKGGAGLLYGPNNLGGVINYISKTPPQKPFEIVNKEEIGEDSLFTSETHAGGQKGNAFYSGSYLRKQGTGFREHDGYGIHDVSGYLGYKINDHSDISSRTYWYYENSQTPGGLTEAQYNANPLQSQNSDDNFKGRRVSTNLVYHNQFTKNQNLETYFNYSFFSRDWFIARQTTTNQQVRRDFNVFTYGAKYRLNYDLLWMKGNDFIIGNDYYFDQEKDVSENGANRTARTGKTLTAFNFLSTFAFAFYATTNLHLTERFTVSPILRTDYVRENIENDITKMGGYTTTTPWLPGVGIDYRLFNKTHLYASYHRSFQPPEFKEAVNPVSGTTSNLQEQIGNHYEIGVKSEAARWLNFDMAGFIFKFENEIVAAGSASVNGQNSRHIGLEASTVLDVFKAAEEGLGIQIPKFFGNVETSFNCTLLDTEFLSGPNKGNQLPYAPNWQFNWAVNYRHPIGLYANINAQWVDEQFSSPDDSRVQIANGSTGIIPSYKVWNLNFGYDLTERFGIFCGIKNLFDEKYFTERDTFFTGIIPAPDRTFYGGVKIKLG